MSQQYSQSVFGVNYGNVFIPEEWLEEHKGKTSFFHGVEPRSPEPGKNEPRVSLADLNTDQFKTKMLQHLKDTIKREHFEKMKELGVRVVRVPCGYWNWVRYSGATTPNAEEEDDAKRMAVLQTLDPDVYRSFFDRIFQLAGENEIQVLLDLHALPGSQNGEMHSGISLRKPYFKTDWNRDKAVEAVSNMAAYGAEKGDILWGIQVLNEYEYNHYTDWLDVYYQRAIDAARVHLAMEVPVVVFSWTKDFGEWRTNHFDSDRFGNIIFDTHIYIVNQVSGNADVRSVYDLYWADLEKLKTFGKRNQVMVGEWSLAGPTWGERKNQELAKWLVWCFAERGIGSFFWTFNESEIAEWNFVKAAETWEIDWKGMAKP